MWHTAELNPNPSFSVDNSPKHKITVLQLNVSTVICVTSYLTKMELGNVTEHAFKTLML